jgi:hypothetical protein
MVFTATTGEMTCRFTLWGSCRLDTRGFAAPRSRAGATYSNYIDNAKLVGDAAVFLEPPAACRRFHFQAIYLAATNSLTASPAILNRHGDRHTNVFE